MFIYCFANSLCGNSAPEWPAADNGTCSTRNDVSNSSERATSANRFVATNDYKDKKLSCCLTSQLKQHSVVFVLHLNAFAKSVSTSMCDGYIAAAKITKRKRVAKRWLCYIFKLSRYSAVNFWSYFKRLRFFWRSLIDLIHFQPLFCIEFWTENIHVSDRLRRIVTFWLLCLINTLTYLLTYLLTSLFWPKNDTAPNWDKNHCCLVSSDK